MLKGIKVLELEGLAPSVFCGMYFADQGADVILVARHQPAFFTIQINQNIMNRNKKCIALSIKDKKEKQILIDLVKDADVIIDPFRPGVLQKLQLGPTQLAKINPKIILLRVTGYGQNGSIALKPGHDLNYISTSGVLKLINKGQKKLQFPTNYMADFVSASLGISGTLKALKQRQTTNSGYIVDCSLTEGCSYLTSLALNNKSRELQVNTQQISYSERGKKRYIITIYSGNRQKVRQMDIQNIIDDMQKDKIRFYKNNKFQIAEIKKIGIIQDSNLKNPFQRFKQNCLKNIIPNRDQHREQIIKSLGLKNSKL